ncbi:MAG TPA: T9SS type A sorting domain-containing protein [Flavobacterium sp.]|nr:T9SS type A sorting domain-containing protein [Flavobacterium sp.]
MKKTLLSLCALGFGFFSQAQVLLDENVSTLTVGNVGTDLTGTTPGQGGWLTSVLAAGSNTDFQVIDQGGNYGNVFQIIGSNTAVNSRRLFKDVSSDWGFRETGNNVAEVQFDFFTGPATTSANSMRVLLYDATLTKMLAGMMVNMSTKVMSGLSYYDNTAAAGGILGNYSFKLGYTATPTPAYSDVVLQPNTWYRMGFSYNYTTGQVIFKESTGLITSPPIMGASAGTEVGQLNMIMTAISTTGQANSVSATGLFDNAYFQASVTSGPILLSVDSNEMAQFAVFPNPAENVINVTNSKNAAVSRVTLTDMNGRTVKQQNFENVSDLQLNISDLAPGMYMMNIKSTQGESVKKIIKS